jgi:hypothetical protein
MSTNAEIAERLFPEAIPAGDMVDRTYKIINLKAQNFLKLKVVDT